MKPIVPTYQRGESFISMMVGLLISMLTVVTMLSAYRSMVAVSVPASQATQRDGQIAAAVLTAQIELQQAGYGIHEAGIDIAASADGKSVIWRYRADATDPNYLCSGLQLVVTPTDPSNDGLYRFDPKDCTTTWPGVTWSVAEKQLVASRTAMFEPDEAEPDEAQEKRRFDLSNARFHVDPPTSCGPFGANVAPNRTRVRFRDDARGVTVFTSCLTNT